jgi:hypothetical protein
MAMVTSEHSGIAMTTMTATSKHQVVHQGATVLAVATVERLSAQAQQLHPFHVRVQSRVGRSQIRDLTLLLVD